MPADIRQFTTSSLLSAEKFGLHEAGMPFTQANHTPGKVEHLLVFFQQAPIKPAQLIILTVTVVVALLTAQDLIPGQDHWNALAEHQHGHEILDLLLSESIHLRVVADTFRPAVPTVVVAVTVAVLLTIGLVMFFIIADHIKEREAVMTGDKVDRVCR